MEVGKGGNPTEVMRTASNCKCYESAETGCEELQAEHLQNTCHTSLPTAETLHQSRRQNS